MIGQRNAAQQAASYCESRIPTHQCNPLILALGERRQDGDALKLMRRKPEGYKLEETRNWSAPERQEMTLDILSLVIPLSVNLEIYTSIWKAVCQGYKDRNPTDISCLQKLKGANELDEKAPSKAGAAHQPISGLVVGLSGAGKSNAVGVALDLLPNHIIVHSEFRGKRINCVQVPVLLVEAPHDGSLKGLLEGILMELGRLVGEDLFEHLPKLREKRNNNLLVLHTVKQIILYSVGLLVIDEAEFILPANENSNRKEDTTIFSLISMMNKAGVPILLIGNPEIKKLIEKHFKGARRLTGELIEMYGLENGLEWDMYISAAWRFQFLKYYTPITDAMRDALFECSAGLLRIALEVYQRAQWMVISRGGDEVITPEIIFEASRKKDRFIRPMIEAVKTNTTESLQIARDLGDPRPKKTRKPKTDSDPETTTSAHVETSDKNKRPEPRLGRVKPAGLVTFLDEKVCGECSPYLALKRHGNIAETTEFWT